MDNFYSEVMSAIREDNIRDFDRLLDTRRGLLSMRFGRFPLLSLMYLYDATVLINVYEERLLGTISYTLAPEDHHASTLFRRKAGHALRLYLTEDDIVTPLEMLAVLDEPARLNYLIREAVRPDQRTLTNIKKIYILHHKRPAKTDGFTVVATPRPLRGARLALIISLIAIYLLFAVGGAVTLRYLTDIYAQPNPILIEREFVANIKNNASVTLTRDVVLSTPWATQDYTGTLDGDGHTLYLNNTAWDAPLFGLFSGDIQNINIVFQKIEMPSPGIDVEPTPPRTLYPEADRALLVKENKGAIKNVTLSIGGLFVHHADYTLDLTANADIEDVFFAGFCVDNFGVIADSKIMGVLNTDTVDVAGVCKTNRPSGRITNTVNAMAITQTTEHPKWNPLVAGIAYENLGTLTSCKNEAQLTAQSLSDGTAVSAVVGGIVVENANVITGCENSGELIAELTAETFPNDRAQVVQVGGIAVFNSSLIEHSKHTGTISASLTRGTVVVGGIVADNANDIRDGARVISSGSLCTVTVNTKSTNSTLIVGGIAGSVAGKISECFSHLSLIVPDINETTRAPAPYVGGIAGYRYVLVRFNTWYFAEYGEFSDNVFFVENNPTATGAGALRSGNTLYDLAGLTSGTRPIFSKEKALELLNDGATSAESLADLKTSEVYW